MIPSYTAVHYVGHTDPCHTPITHTGSHTHVYISTRHSSLAASGISSPQSPSPPPPCPHTLPERIWPFCYSLGVFPYNIIFTEDEEGSVDCEAVLFDRDGVVESHSPGPLSHRLLIHPLAGLGATLPAAPSSSPGRPSTSIAGWQIIPKPSHFLSARSRALQSKLAAESRGRRITARSTSPSGGFSCGIGIDRSKIYRYIFLKKKKVYICIYIPFPSSTPSSSPPLWLPGGGGRLRGSAHLPAQVPSLRPDLMAGAGRVAGRAGAAPSALTGGAPGREGAALLPCPPRESSAVPSPAQPGSGSGSGPARPRRM